MTKRDSSETPRWPKGRGRWRDGQHRSSLRQRWLAPANTDHLFASAGWRRPTPISSSPALAVVPLFAAVASEVAVVSHSSSFAWAGEQPRPGLVIPRGRHRRPTGDARLVPRQAPVGSQ